MFVTPPVEPLSIRNPHKHIVPNTNLLWGNYWKYSTDWRKINYPMSRSQPGPLGDLPNMRWCPVSQRYFADGSRVNDTTMDDYSYNSYETANHMTSESSILDKVRLAPVDKRILPSLKKRSRAYSDACAICHRSAVDAMADRRMRFVSLPCKHTFHLYCVEQWLSNRNGSCPLCRSPVDTALAAAATAASSHIQFN
jgi:hypothetical protein